MRTRLIFLRIGLAVGALLACAPVLGMLGTMIGMARAFNTLGQSGIGDSRQLSSAIAGTLLATTGGLVLFPCGIVLLIVCGLLLKQSRRTRPPPLPRYPEGDGRPSRPDLRAG